jgi:ClpP class serine protease
LGLVDELGGIDTAIRVAKQLAHIPAGERVNIVRFPEEKSFLEQVFEREREMTSGEAVIEAEAGSSAYGLPAADAKAVDAIVRRIIGRMDIVQARIAYELHIN